MRAELDSAEPFVAKLRRLHRLVGAPSLNRLAALSANLERPLPRSTISDKLTGKSLPEWDFVVSFVTACRMHVEKTGTPVPQTALDLSGWDAAHLRMLRAVDDERDDRRRSAAAQAELARRASRLPLAAAPAAPGAASHVLPRQLPAPVRHFAGRAAELAALDRLLPAGDTAPAVCAIEGTGGIGKSALALYWAHRAAERFPDGQLYVNMRGFDPGGTAVSPAEAVRGFLAALGVSPDQVPADPDAATGLYRSLLAGRRMLVVLDNVVDSAHARPLLPGSPACRVLVTSRSRLSALVADGADALTLDVLPRQDAYELLARRLGPARVAAEQPAVQEILARCAGLPLALSVVAARAAMHPRFPLADIARDLRPDVAGLGAFASLDAAIDVRSVFSWSYRLLGTGCARLFRLLGAHPGPDVTVGAAASMSGATTDLAGAWLGELSRAHLVEEHRPNRYGCHDLLRAYAIELADGVDAPEERGAAVHRLLDHLVHAAYAAALLVNPHRDRITPEPAGSGAPAEPLAGQEHALAWFTDEYPVLLRCVDLAVRTGHDTHAWQLAWALADFSDRQGRWHAWLAVQQTALGAARRCGLPAVEAFLHRKLGLANARLGRFAAAQREHNQALRLYRQLRDPAGLGHTHRDLAWLYGQQQRHRDALRHIQQALAAYREAGHRVGQARCLNSIGWCRAELGEFRDALVACRRALALHQEIGDRLGEAATWDTIGYAHHHLDEHAQALACYRQAIELFQAAGSRYHEADSLTHLGDTQYAAADPAGCAVTWQRALDILTELGHADAEQVRARLAGQPEGRLRSPR